ncbi:MAG: LacI family DNA-binding transcriptional regulator [Spirochaetia bacterium]|jgi:DNA-binding LacI/PurR family transcriptional regulator
MAVIKDVARLAGVSPSTVSKYLNNSPTLKDSYRERIRKAVEELDYTPSRIARSMRTGRKNLIAVIVPSILNPFYSELYNAIRVESLQKGYTPVLYATDENMDVLRTVLVNLGASQVDGAILCFLDEEEIINRLEELETHTPVALMSWHVQSTKFSCVVVDVHSAILSATNHLIRLGHKKIGYVGGRLSRSISQEKLRAFRLAMATADLPLREELIVADHFRFDTGFNAARAFMQANDPPTGIVAANDLLAIGCVKYLINNGFRVPDDVAVIGHDGIQLASIYDPSISTMAQPIVESGRAVVDMVIARIEKPASKKKLAVFKFELKVRRSTDKSAPIVFEF